MHEQPPVVESMDPPAKRQKMDGDIGRVNTEILNKAKDVENWISERRKNWPTTKRTEERKAAAALEPPAPAPGPTTPTAKPPHRKPMCRFFLRGTCKAGSACKFSHERQPQGPKIYKRFEAPTKASLFTKMVQQDLDREDDKVIDFICYIRDQGLLD